MGSTFAAAPEPAKRVLRAIDVQTNKVVWELPQFGAVDSWGGVHSTAGDVVFFATTAGPSRRRTPMRKAAVELQTSQVWKSSPMTYVFDNRPCATVASGPSITGLRSSVGCVAFNADGSPVRADPKRGPANAPCVSACRTGLKRDTWFQLAGSLRRGTARRAAASTASPALRRGEAQRRALRPTRGLCAVLSRLKARGPRRSQRSDFAAQRFRSFRRCTSEFPKALELTNTPLGQLL
jgi:hypothetical protein